MSIKMLVQRKAVDYVSVTSSSFFKPTLGKSYNELATTNTTMMERDSSTMVTESRKQQTTLTNGNLIYCLCNLESP